MPVGQFDDPVGHRADPGARYDLHSTSGKLTLSVTANLTIQLWQNDFVRRHENKAQVLRAQVGVEADRFAHKIVDSTKGLDARIDDPKASWKGRGLWSSEGDRTPWLKEGGKGMTPMAVHIQVRPDPLAH